MAKKKKPRKPRNSFDFFRGETEAPAPPPPKRKTKKKKQVKKSNPK